MIEILLYITAFFVVLTIATGYGLMRILKKSDIERCQ